MLSDWVDVQIRSDLDAGELLALLDDPFVPGAWQDDRTIHLYWPSQRWTSEHLARLRQTLRRLAEWGVADPEIIVHSLAEAVPLYCTLLGIAPDAVEYHDVPSEGVRVAMLKGNTTVELLEPTEAAGALARFLEKRGPGLHHWCYAVPAPLEDKLAELKAAEASGDQEHVTEEMGDVLFVMANLARKLKVDPEEALRRANAKFTRRFQYIESRLAEQGRSGPQPLDDMEALWLEAKRAEKPR